MATITFNGPARTITLGYDGPVTTVNAVDIYSRWKEWIAAGNAQHLPAFSESVGGNDLGGGVLLGKYVFLRNDYGWRIVPSSTPHQLVIEGELYPFNPNVTMFSLAGANIIITQVRAGTTTIAETGGGGGSVDYDRIRREVVNGVAAHVWAS